jgi:hypothetical protein
LGVLPRGDRHPGFAVELFQLLQNDGSGRHVDTQGERLGGEHGLDQLAPEQFLDDLLERGKHAGVVRRHAALQSIEPLPVTENGEVLVGDRAAALFDVGADLVAFVLLGQPHPGAENLQDSLVASVAAEDEEDGRQQVLRAEQGDDFGAIRALTVKFPRVVSIASIPPAAAAVLPAGPCPGTSARGQPHQFGVDSIGRPGLDAGAGGIEQVNQLGPHQYVLVERDRTLLRDDHGCLATDGLQPVAELLRVGDRRAE